MRAFYLQSETKIINQSPGKNNPTPPLWPGRHANGPTSDRHQPSPSTITHARALPRVGTRDESKPACPRTAHGARRTHLVCPTKQAVVSFLQRPGTWPHHPTHRRPVRPIKLKLIRPRQAGRAPVGAVEFLRGLETARTAASPIAASTSSLKTPDRTYQWLRPKDFRS